MPERGSGAGIGKGRGRGAARFTHDVGINRTYCRWSKRLLHMLTALQSLTVGCEECMWVSLQLGVFRHIGLRATMARMVRGLVA